MVSNLLGQCFRIPKLGSNLIMQSCLSILNALDSGRNTGSRENQGATENLLDIFSKRFGVFDCAAQHRDVLRDRLSQLIDKTIEIREHPGQRIGSIFFHPSLLLKIADRLSDL
nr:MAG TPA: hypothetical protein [Caudoviricetes sp.]